MVTQVGQRWARSAEHVAAAAAKVASGFAEPAAGTAAEAEVGKPGAGASDARSALVKDTVESAPCRPPSAAAAGAGRSDRGGVPKLGADISTMRGGESGGAFKAADSTLVGALALAGGSVSGDRSKVTETGGLALPLRTGGVGALLPARRVGLTRTSSGAHSSGSDLTAPPGRSDPGSGQKATAHGLCRDPGPCRYRHHDQQPLPARHASLRDPCLCLGRSATPESP